MPIKTTKTLLEHINDAWKGKVVYWINNDAIQYGILLQVTSDGTVMVTKEGLSKTLLKHWQGKSTLYALTMKEAWMGITEIAIINN